MTVGELEERLTYRELVEWGELAAIDAEKAEAEAKRAEARANRGGRGRGSLPRRR